MGSLWDTVGYVISSGYRVSVVRRLAAATSTPTELASTMGVSTTHVSRALGQLRERNLVTAATADGRPTRREYALTRRGESVWETIDANGLAI